MNTLDILSYLPRPRIAEFSKGHTVYGPDRPAEYLHLVISGSVKVFTTARDGRHLLLRIVSRDGLFGECALVPGEVAARQSALALDRTQAMSWSAEEVQKRIESHPKLAMALLEHFAASNCRLEDRLKALAGLTTGPRVTFALLQLARETGVPRPDGSQRITGLTHQAIAEYVGTSREIVTSEMNRLRRLGYVSYTRRHLDIFADAMAERQRQEAGEGVAREAFGQAGTA
jgi:CRP-like cAMP-binding protein